MQEPIQPTMTMVSNFIPRRSLRRFAFQTRNKINYNSVVWIDAVAIYLAVLVVSGVGSIVDYLKEQEFTKRANEENAGYKVSSKIILN